MDTLAGEAPSSRRLSKKRRSLSILRWRRRASRLLFRRQPSIPTCMIPQTDSKTLRRLQQGEVWVGMSIDFLRASVGQPDAVERHARPTGVLEIWKYEPLDLLSYRLEVRIEDERVSQVQDHRQR